MRKAIRNLIWTLTALVMILFSIWGIKNNIASSIVNIIGSLIFLKQFMKLSNQGSKKAVFCCYIGMVAFLVSILIDLIQLCL